MQERPEYERPKYSKECLDKDECPYCPDLLLLRDAAIDERAAILQYLNAAKENCLSELFFEVAEDEMEHYVQIMQQVTRLDPIQAQAFQSVNLDMMIMTRRPPKKNTLAAQFAAQADDDLLLPPDRNMPAICHLTAALIEELKTVNKYQRYMLEACDPQVKKLFCELMNDEKEHIAQFNAALFDLTYEPLILDLD